MSGVAARSSGSQREAQGNVQHLQAADDGVAAMASQDSDGGELKLAMEYLLLGAEVLAEMDEDDRVLNALWAQAKANKERQTPSPPASTPEQQSSKTHLFVYLLFTANESYTELVKGTYDDNPTPFHNQA